MMMLTPATKEITIPKVEMMKRIIGNSVSNLRDQAQLPHALDLEQALSLGLQIDSDKNLQMYFVHILCMCNGGDLLMVHSAC